MNMKLSKETMLEMAQKLVKMDFCPEQKTFYKNVLEMVKADAEGRLVVLPCKVGDTYFDRAALVNSDNQIYKQAGNGVTVPVIQEIAAGMRLEDLEG